MGNKVPKQPDFQKWIDEQKKKEERKFRILLLGPGDSGKSTILKQMKQIGEMHKANWEMGDHLDMIPFIRESIFIYIHTLCKSNELMLNASNEICDENIKNDIKINENIIELKNFFVKNKITRFDSRNIEFIENNSDNENESEIENEIDEESINNRFYKIFKKYAISHIKPLWDDKGIKNTMKYRRMFIDQIPDCAIYFLDKIETIADENYVPGFKDYVRHRTKTSGAQTANITIDLDKISNDENNDNDNNINGDNDKTQFGCFDFEFTDIGGQSAERHKWPQVMNDSINVVLFIAAIPEYDLPCYENYEKRRMGDALDAFNLLMNFDSKKGPNGIKFVENKQVFVLFNKWDLLKEKLEKIPLQSIPEFSDFTYDAKEEKLDITEKVEEYFKNKFCDVIANIKEKDSQINDKRHVKLNFDTSKQLTFYNSQALNTELIQTVFHKIMLQVVTRNLQGMGMAN